ncbi:MAG: peptidoglycan-binding protein [Gammaproteobacteria bacterium]
MREDSTFGMDPFDEYSESDEYDSFWAVSKEIDQGEASRVGPEYIRWIQRSLNKILGLRLVVDGIMGPATRSAVRRFQQIQGLTSDGVVGPQTDQRLRLLVGGPSPTPATATCPPTPAFVDCPSPGTPFETLDQFAFDGVRLNPRIHTSRLIRVARRIITSQSSRNPIRFLTIAGHTDPVGDEDYNFLLSRRRAEEVMRELCATLERLSPGLARRIKFQLSPCGERQPKGVAAQSRRVEIFLPTKKAPPPKKGCSPFKERIRLHLKILVPPTRFSIATMLNSMQQVYGPIGFLVEVASRENLKLPDLEELDLFCPGSVTQICCPFPTATNNLNPEHVALFQHRKHVGVNEVAVYFVRTTVPGLNGCAAHPPGRPGVVVTASASRWTLGHEVGHVLGLQHVNNSDRLMTGGGTNNITNPPPDLVAPEIQKMTQSMLTIPC